MPLATQRGGAEQLLRHLVRHRSAVPDATWSVVFFEEGPLRAEAEAEGVFTWVLETGRLRQPLNYLRTARALMRMIQDLRPTVVVSWMSKAHLYAGPAAWLAGVPALWYQHGIPTHDALMDRLITLVPAAGVLACSRVAADAQRKLWPHRRTEVVYPCVDLTAFDPARLPAPAAARTQLGLPGGGPLIGMVGRLQRWKGVHTLIQAMPAILEKHPDTHCVIVGGPHDLEPDYPAYLAALIGELNLSSKITLAGFQADVPLWMQAMDVIVHASDHEPFGMVVVEAMALGKLVVAGSDGGPTEIIAPGYDGALAPYGDARTLAVNTAGWLDMTPSRTRHVRQRARTRSRHFRAPEYPSRLILAVKRLIEPAPAHAPIERA